MPWCFFSSPSFRAFSGLGWTPEGFPGRSAPYSVDFSGPHPSPTLGVYWALGGHGPESAVTSGLSQATRLHESSEFGHSATRLGFAAQGYVVLPPPQPPPRLRSAHAPAASSLASPILIVSSGSPIDRAGPQRGARCCPSAKASSH
eukprot:8628235-Pyramimonas_sp.AAC.1